MPICTCRILVGDVRRRLLDLPSESVDCVVTSPPYWGLRDYGIDGQIGLEETPEQFVALLVDVFREVRRVLKPRGIAWVNMGDSYANDGKWGGETGGKQSYLPDADRRRNGRERRVAGLKPKDLVGVPWRLAFAMQADGWWLRSEVIWHKPNPMPESVQDRPTKAHEQVFLFAKSEHYYYDAGAIAEPSKGDHLRNGNGLSDFAVQAPGQAVQSGITKLRRSGNKERSYDGAVGDRPDDHLGRGVPWTDENGTRNARTVWSIATQPFAEAHFATFPEELARRCILSGCPSEGTVLDPFFGAGTVGVVAARMGRSSIGTEINPEYAKMAKRRVDGACGLVCSTSID